MYHNVVRSISSFIKVKNTTDTTNDTCTSENDFSPCNLPRLDKLYYHSFNQNFKEKYMVTDNFRSYKLNNKSTPLPTSEKFIKT